MKTPDAILVDLIGFPSTTDSLAELHRIPYLVAKSILVRHEKDGLVARNTRHIMEPWLLTASGKDRAVALQAPCTP